MFKQSAVTCLTLLLLIVAVQSLAKSAKDRHHPHKILKNVQKAPGSVFPKPQVQSLSDEQHRLNGHSFSFVYKNGSVECSLLREAFDRIYRIIFKPYEYAASLNKHERVRKSKMPSKHSEPLLNGHFKDGDDVVLNTLEVNIDEACEDYPNLESDESYYLSVDSTSIELSAKSIWGVIRGLETFSQLVMEADDNSLVINETRIYDYPRFAHRGILLDTSRHYIEPSILKVNLEAMSATKMNVFHWHIVDDQSFPYESITYPDMSVKGAFDPYNHVYTSHDVQDIIAFARVRGIRVVPEFDSPGHTLSWGNAIPMLTPCYKGNVPNGQFGPIDPSNNVTYTFWESFIKELATVFPDKYLHLGGDEVDFSCWQSNPDVNAFMAKMGFGSDFSKLEQYYEQNLLDIVKRVSPETGYIIWQEVIDNNVTVKSDTVVEVWKDPWPEELALVTSKGYRALLSTCWYLNYISYGSDWVNYYKCEPLNFTGTPEQKDLVIGGEACMWGTKFDFGEYVDGTNVIQRTWPRVNAVAERLWSAVDVTDISDASARIEQSRCRMIRRGIAAEPFDGPGFCDYEITYDFD